MADRPDTHLWYGETDSGKTVQLGEAAKWEFARSGMISRLISADSGWDPLEDPQENLILSLENPGGIIEAWNIQYLPDPWVPLIELSEGSWPQTFQKPDGSWGLRMKRPSLSPDGRILSGDGRKVGQYLIEGLSTIGEIGLQDHVRNQRPMWGTGKEQGTSFTSVVTQEGPSTVDGKPGPMKQKEMTFGRAVGGHYGSVQNFMLLDLIPRFGALRPIKRVIWTAHEGKGKDDITGIEASVLGPAIVGQASVDRTPQKFGHTLHFRVETGFGPKGEVQREFQAWFVKHPDRVLSKMFWPAKVSLSKDQSKDLLARFPRGYIPMGDAGMTQFLEFLDTKHSSQDSSSQDGNSSKP